jgi:excinuclease ABC subunit C
VGHITQPEYRQALDEVIQILDGKAASLIQKLRERMDQAAEQEEYELAAVLRDQIRNLEIVTETQGAIEAGSQRDRDVLGLARKSSQAHGTLLKVRGGRLIAIQHYRLQNVEEGLSDAEIIEEYLSQYYASLQLEKGQLEKEQVESERVPNEVLVPVAPEDPEWLERTLGVRLLVAESPVDQQLLNVARANAEFALEQIIKRASAEGHGFEALEEVQDKLHLAKLPHRIECYDISNIQGEDAVASRVVFVDGAPDKNLYRRYKIRTVEGANDFAMMKEVLHRRFSNTEEALPDLVVVDGGKGQLAQAVAILDELGDELGLQGVSVVGLAKARTESNFRKKEVESSMERIFIPNRVNPVPLYPNSKAYRILVHIRDEAHRFAVSYHRTLRSKRTFKTGP